MPPITQTRFDTLLDSRNSALHYIDLSSLSLLRIQGEDAESFLQGQLSNDISRLEPARAQLHAWCNPKGRALAILRIMRMRGADGFWALLPAELTTSFTKRLRMFVMRAKVTIETASDYRSLGLIGATSATLPDFNESGCAVYAVDEARSRYLLIGSHDSVARIMGKAGSSVLPDDYWRALDILSGIPQVYSVTAEAFIPQNINLELIDGVSFKKGCYPGQEIVARLKYLGKSKKRLIIARVNASDPVAPGDPVYAGNKPESKAGVIVDSVAVDNRTWLVSAMVPATAITHGALAIAPTAENLLERLTPPYPIPDA